MISNYLIEVDGLMQNGGRSWFRSDAFEQRALDIASIAVMMQDVSGQVASNGYVRAQFTSDIIGHRIRSIDIEVNPELPCLSVLRIPADIRFQIDVLKHMTFELHIKSPRLKLIEFRGKQIVSELFECFEKDVDGELMPGDWRERLRSFNGFSEKSIMRKRLICDYISGMTDAYALDLYARLKSTNPAALFRPF